jgi:hypothetical protein
MEKEVGEAVPHIKQHSFRRDKSQLDEMRGENGCMKLTQDRQLEVRAEVSD